MRRYTKYNSTLRGVRSKNARQFARWYAGCKGNQFSTTVHVINSAVHKCRWVLLSACGGFFKIILSKHWSFN